MAEAGTAAHWRAEKAQPLEDSESPTGKIPAAHHTQVAKPRTSLPPSHIKNAQIHVPATSEEKPEAERNLGHLPVKSDLEHDTAGFTNKEPPTSSLARGATHVVPDNGKTTLPNAPALPEKCANTTAHSASQDAAVDWSLPIGEELGTILEDSAATHGRPGVRPAKTRVTHLIKQGLGMSWGLASWSFGTATGVVKSTAASATAAGTTLVHTIGAAQAVGSGVLHTVSCRAHAVGAHLRGEGEGVRRSAGVAAEQDAAALQQHITQAAAAALNRSLLSVKLTVERLAAAVSVSLDKTWGVIYYFTGAACGLLSGLASAARLARADWGPAERGSSSKAPSKSANSSSSSHQKPWNKYES